MKISILKTLPVVAAALLLSSACAQEDVSLASTGEKAQTYLNLYLQKNFPGLEPNENGIYILEESLGSGKTWCADSIFTYATSTIRTLSGTISTTTDKDLSQQLGTYVFGNYYGPKYQQLGKDVSYAGVDALFTDMCMGGSRTAIIPAWMLTTSRYDTQDEYISNCSQETHYIYTVSLVDQCNDIDKMEKDSLGCYVRRHYGDIPSCSFTDFDPDGSVYFVTDTTLFEGVTPFPRDTTLTINYTGYLLNGQIFDTTLERSAKDGGIYNASKTYSPVSITFSENYTEISMSGSTSLITGFKGGLHMMKWQGQSATILFTSAYGYAATGSGSTIPSYSPLVFELEIL